MSDYSTLNSALEGLLCLALLLSIVSWVWRSGADEGLEALSRRGVPSNDDLRAYLRLYRMSTTALALSLIASAYLAALCIGLNLANGMANKLAQH